MTLTDDEENKFIKCISNGEYTNLTDEDIIKLKHYYPVYFKYGIDAEEIEIAYNNKILTDKELQEYERENRDNKLINDSKIDKLHEYLNSIEKFSEIEYFDNKNKIVDFLRNMYILSSILIKEYTTHENENMLLFYFFHLKKIFLSFYEKNIVKYYSFENANKKIERIKKMDNYIIQKLDDDKKEDFISDMLFIKRQTNFLWSLYDNKVTNKKKKIPPIKNDFLLNVKLKFHSKETKGDGNINSFIFRPQANENNNDIYKKMVDLYVFLDNNSFNRYCDKKNISLLESLRDDLKNINYDKINYTDDNNISKDDLEYVADQILSKLNEKMKSLKKIIKKENNRRIIHILSLEQIRKENIRNILNNEEENELEIKVLDKFIKNENELKETIIKEKEKRKRNLMDFKEKIETIREKLFLLKEKENNITTKLKNKSKVLTDERIQNKKELADILKEKKEIEETINLNYKEEFIKELIYRKMEYNIKCKIIANKMEKQKREIIVKNANYFLKKIDNVEKKLQSDLENLEFDGNKLKKDLKDKKLKIVERASTIIANNNIVNYEKVKANDLSKEISINKLKEIEEKEKKEIKNEKQNEVNQYQNFSQNYSDEIIVKENKLKQINNTISSLQIEIKKSDMDIIELKNNIEELQDKIEKHNEYYNIKKYENDREINNLILETQKQINENIEMIEEKKNNIILKSQKKCDNEIDKIGKIFKIFKGKETKYSFEENITQNLRQDEIQENIPLIMLKMEYFKKQTLKEFIKNIIIWIEDDEPTIKAIDNEDDLKILIEKRIQEASKEKIYEIIDKHIYTTIRNLNNIRIKIIENNYINSATEKFLIPKEYKNFAVKLLNDFLNIEIKNINKQLEIDTIESESNEIKKTITNKNIEYLIDFEYKIRNNKFNIADKIRMGTYKENELKNFLKTDEELLPQDLIPKEDFIIKNDIYLQINDKRVIFTNTINKLIENCTSNEEKKIMIKGILLELKDDLKNKTKNDLFYTQIKLIKLKEKRFGIA